MPEVKISRQRQKKKKIFIKREFAFFLDFSRLLQVAYFFKCRQTHIQVQKGKRVNHRLFTTRPKKQEIRNFHVEVTH